MSIEVTVILDSGCFLPSEKKEGLAPGRYYANIGYFQNPKGCADIRVLVDDEERVFNPCLELEDNNDHRSQACSQWLRQQGRGHRGKDFS